MNDLNSVTLSGNLVRDAELKQLNGGFNVLDIAIANNYSRKDGDNWVDEVNFFELRMFGKRAEALAPHLKKGTSISAICKARQNRWEKDGKKFSSVNFVIDDIKLSGSARKQSDNSSSNAPDGEFHEDIPF
jgi:single-strand DNA-binding protein